MPVELQAMNFIKGETFVNYSLLEDIEQARKAGVFTDSDVKDENEERHVSELERRMSALDEKETYIVVKTLIKNHWDTFSKSIHYIKEGETT